jgi:hypothetical protein
MKKFKSFDHWVMSGMPTYWPYWNNNFRQYAHFPDNSPLHLYMFALDKKDNPIVDFIGRYENLQEDFNNICNAIGITPVELLHKNKSKRPRNYRKLYNNTTKKIVAKVFAKDIELFKYTF